MKKMLLTAAGAAAILTAAIASTPVVAQDDDDDMPRWHRHMMKEWMGEGWGGYREGRGPMRRFMIIDVNDDGQISDDEAAAQREMVFLAITAQQLFRRPPVGVVNAAAAPVIVD